MNALIRFFHFLRNFFAVHPEPVIPEVLANATPTILDNHVSVSTPVALEMSASITFKPVIEKTSVIAGEQQAANLSTPSIVTPDSDYRLKGALVVPNPKGGHPRKAKFRSSNGRILTARILSVEDGTVELVRRPGGSPFRRRLDRINA